jgi:3-hydroxyisobutyrate dehydrogenase
MTGTVRSETVGVIGVGNMGGAIATSLLREHFQLVVYDQREEAVAELVRQGARAAGSIEELAPLARVVSIVVVNQEQLTSAVRAVLPSAARGSVIVVHSTVLPSTVVDLAAEAAEFGVRLVDAPVTGGADRAALGKLTLMIGGDGGSVQYCWPLFEAIGDSLFHLGPVGAGQAMKLAHNVMSLGSYTVYMDAMELAKAYGLDEDSVVRVVTTGQADSRGLRTWGRLDRFRRQHPDFGTPAVYDRIAKDQGGALTAGRDRGLELPMVAAIAELLPRLAARRDQDPTTWPATPIPCCRICGQELAAPFRDGGAHPECRYGVEEDATTSSA